MGVYIFIHPNFKEVKYYLLIVIILFSISKTTQIRKSYLEHDH